MDNGVDFSQTGKFREDCCGKCIMIAQMPRSTNIDPKKGWGGGYRPSAIDKKQEIIWKGLSSGKIEMFKSGISL